MGAGRRRTTANIRATRFAGSNRYCAGDWLIIGAQFNSQRAQIRCCTHQAVVLKPDLIGEFLTLSDANFNEYRWGLFNNLQLKVVLLSFTKCIWPHWCVLAFDWKLVSVDWVLIAAIATPTAVIASGTTRCRRCTACVGGWIGCGPLTPLQVLSLSGWCWFGAKTLHHAPASCDYWLQHVKSTCVATMPLPIGGISACGAIPPGVTKVIRHRRHCRTRAAVISGKPTRVPVRVTTHIIFAVHCKRMAGFVGERCRCVGSQSIKYVCRNPVDAIQWIFTAVNTALQSGALRNGECRYCRDQHNTISL